MNLYGIMNRSTIDSKPIITGCEKYTREFVFNKNLNYITYANVRGYMNVTLSTVHAYNGRYGKGYVRIVPCYHNGKPSKII